MPTAPRVAILDVLRGIAILLIFFFNIPAMGNSNYSHFGALTVLGWSAADRVCWCLLNVFLEGTQRGLLELLFGAGALLLLQNAMGAEGSIAAVDRYFRRNLWLMMFGLADIFGLLWFGDILLAYGFVALFLFPFRRLKARTLLILTVLFVIASAVSGSRTFRSELRTNATAQRALEKQARRLPINEQEKQAVAAQAKSLSYIHVPAAALSLERQQRQGSLRVYVRTFHSVWIDDVLHGGMLPAQLLEAFFSMLLGMALWKLRIIQGGRSGRFYVGLVLACYVPALAERTYATWQQIQFLALPNIDTIFGAGSRLAITVGHISVINLIMKTRVGSAALSAFKAPGRMAFSLYLMQNALGCWILFPSFTLGLWGRYGWSGLSGIAAMVMAVQLVLANVWMRLFAIGPMEWLWRSLSYKQVQPFLHRNVEDRVLLQS